MHNKLRGKLLNNYIYNTLYVLTTLLIPLITTPYVSRVLGAESIGEYSFATSIVTYFVIFSGLGSSIYGQRTIAFYRDDVQKLSDCFWNIVFFRVISSIVAILLYSSFLILTNSGNILSWILSLNIVNVVFDISWFFQGIEEFKIVAVRNMLIKVINGLAIFVFVRTESDNWIYALLITVFLVSSSASLWPELRKYIEKPSVFKPFTGIREMLLVFLPTIATQVYTVLDKSMLGWITASNYSNGCYEQSEKIARICLSVVTSLGTVILPRVAHLYSKNDYLELKRYVYLGYRMVWFLAIPLSFGIYSVADIVVPLYLGSGYDESVLLLQIFSLLLVFVGCAHTTGIVYLIPTKQQNVYTISVLVAAVVNFIMNMLLLPYIGAIGAAIASVSAEFIGAFVQLAYCIIKKKLEIGPIIKPFFKYSIFAFVMYLCVMGIKGHLGTEWISFGIISIVGCIIYLGLAIGTRDTLVFEVLKVINNKLRSST